MRAYLPAAVAAAFLGCASLPHEDLLREADRRVPDSEALKGAARSGSQARRLEAVLAMGRVQSPSYVRPLIERLGDPSAKVREEAAFALGQSALFESDGPEEPSRAQARSEASRALLLLADHGSSGLRLASVEALGKTGGEGVEEALLAALRDPDAPLRGEAALALFRLRHLKRVPEYSTAAVRGLAAAFRDNDAQVRWKSVYAFSRFPEPRAAEDLAQAASDAEPWARFFACRALGQLKERAPVEALVRAAGDGDALVRTEAVKALGAAGRAELLPESVFRDASAHVRAAAADAVASSADPRLARRLGPLEGDPSAMVRGQVLLALAKLLKGRAAAAVASQRGSPHWWVRSRAYLATADVPGTGEVLRDGLKDPDTRVAAAALEALAKGAAKDAKAEVESVLRDPRASVEILGAAVEAAGELGSPELLAALGAAHASAAAARFPELRGDIAKAARTILAAHPGMKDELLPSAPPMTLKPSRHLTWVPKPARVLFETEKGDIEIELASVEAPVHAASFLENVRRGVYDGSVWHRVVSGFVIQGGDPRGSGWGDAGETLRDEVNRLRYGRGAVGMPKAGKDTGGCQVFITHVPAPHLDGRYTVFGRVVRGMEAVDRMEPGDRILRARPR